MSGLSVLERLPSVNGTGKRQAIKPKTKAKQRRKGMKHARRLACAVGAVGVGVLGLSVAHCTESIGLLTGSHWALSALLAIGIDAGMVVSELAELASHGTKAGERVRPWACGYTVAAVLLSVLLNAYAFGLHAAPGMTWAAWLLGAVIPGLVYALGRVAGHLWQAGE
jgi:hypothetical protein